MADITFIIPPDLDDIERGTAMSPELLWRESRSVWCARVEPLWADFCGARATNYKPAPLLDATPLTAWLCFADNFSRIWIVARTCGLAGLQLNHYQMLTIVIGVVVPAVELTFVLPSNCPGQESSRDLDSVPLDSSSLQDLKMVGSEATMAPSMMDRDSGVLATTSVEVYQPIPIEEPPPPSPGLSFGGMNFTLLL
ncbi:hypothetical protein HF086_001542 [Spodoptera exigua]|uniref:Uncharacterized protein n=1 Tax=Spodoptera exigua TaxID=7107 RepID=A0A922MSN0_SPOEX|nr:hypothetical protein HF086_001542 [Spodoptera exigua]